MPISPGLQAELSRRLSLDAGNYPSAKEGTADDARSGDSGSAATSAAQTLGSKGSQDGSDRAEPLESAALEAVQLEVDFDATLVRMADEDGEDEDDEHPTTTAVYQLAALEVPVPPHTPHLTPEPWSRTSSAPCPAIAHRSCACRVAFSLMLHTPVSGTGSTYNGRGFRSGSVSPPQGGRRLRLDACHCPSRRLSRQTRGHTSVSPLRVPFSDSVGPSHFWPRSGRVCVGGGGGGG